MKKTNTKKQIFPFLLTIVFCAMQLPQLVAQPFNSVQSGNWHDGSTWDKGTVPGIGDDVIIDGDSIYINNTSGPLIEVNSITITNADDLEDSYLFVTQATVVSVANDLIVTSERFNHKVELNISGAARVNVGGDMTFTRTTDNTHYRRLRLEMLDSSKLFVDNDFSFYYGNSHSWELLTDVYLEGSSLMEVKGNAKFHLVGGTALDIKLIDSSSVNFKSNLILLREGGGNLLTDMLNKTSMQVDGNISILNIGNGYDNYFSIYHTANVVVDSSLILKSTSDNEKSVFTLGSSGASLEVKEDIVMHAGTEGDVGIGMSAGGDLKLGGYFSRPTLFGYLDMGATASLTYNGTKAQTPAESDLGGGADVFNFTNVAFDNTSGVPMVLNAPMIVADELSLTNGIITTDGVNSLTIADGATISGGNNNAYINGPLIKQGTTPEPTFVFPIGNGGVYAPLEMAAPANTTDQFMVTYMNCPPPFGNNVSDGLRISALEYWTVEKTAGTPDVDIRLHWMDAERSGIDNTDSLVMAMYNSGMATWDSLGNGGVAGGTGSEVWGAIWNNSNNCPPPFGNGAQDMLTFGTYSTLFNALPVELVNFQAKIVRDNVELYWETESERDNDYFVLEKSADGKTFSELKVVNARGAENIKEHYAALDTDPYKGFNYYRLKQVDLDGSFFFSDMIALSMDNSGEALLFPNPVENYINISMSEISNAEVAVQVFNSAGKLQFAKVYPMQGGVFRMTGSEIENLEAGYHTILLKNSLKTHSLKFLKLSQR